MERTKQAQQVSTKANNLSLETGGTLFSEWNEKDFLAYQRDRRISEAKRAIAKTQISVTETDDLRFVCQRAVRLHQAAVRVPLRKLTATRYYLGNAPVALDCAVGGDGETLTKVKAYETKLAVRRRATEITLSVAQSLLDACRFGEIQKELSKIKRAAGKAKLKVRVNKCGSPTALARLARIASESGARYFSVPYFDGCERLRAHLSKACALEITGVNDVETFKKLVCAGVERIDTKRGFETYTQLLQEAQEIKNEATVYETKEEITPPCPQQTTEKTPEKNIDTNSETDYRCRIEDGKLKFL